MYYWDDLTAYSFRMKSRLILYILILVLASSCQSVNHSDGIETNDYYWAKKAADAVISEHKSLVYYNRAKGKEKIQYDVAMLGMAIDELGSTDEKYSLYLKDYVDFFVDSTGNMEKFNPEEYNLDRINFAKSLITLYKRTGEKKYLIALQSYVNQIENQPRTHSGGFWHKKIYPDQMWLDGSYMVLPFIAQYAKEFNRPEWFNLAADQLILLYNVTLGSSSGLLYHAWDENKTQPWCNPQTGQSHEFWGRAMGWYIMALVDVLDYLPDSHPAFKPIVKLLNDISEAILSVRDPQKLLWYQVLDKGGKEGNYLEASCSAMFIYAFAKGAQQGYLEARFLNVAQESFNAFLKEFVVSSAGDPFIITHICSAAGLGGDPYRDGSYEYYISEKQTDNDPKGTGAFILAAIELKR
jgi:unsaturated rhamnogalacturonyl hydrolase